MTSEPGWPDWRSKCCPSKSSKAPFFPLRRSIGSEIRLTDALLSNFPLAVLTAEEESASGKDGLAMAMLESPCQEEHADGIGDGEGLKKRSKSSDLRSSYSTILASMLGATCS